MPGLVLHLRHQDRLAAQAGRPGDPVALGLHPDDLGVRVLRDLPDEVLAVGVRHRVPRLDPTVGVDDPLEVVEPLGTGLAGGRRTGAGAGRAR